MAKLTRSQAKVLAEKLVREGGCCPLCQRPWSVIIADYEAKCRAAGRTRTQAPYVLDHCHETGLCRGVLCRGCNGAEGKVINAIAAWGKTGKSYVAIQAWMHRLLNYLEGEKLPYTYPTHLSADEKKRAAGNTRKAAAQAKVRQRRAQIKAIKSGKANG